MAKKQARSMTAGRALANARQNASKFNKTASSRHCDDSTEDRPSGRSVIDESSLNEFLSTAELAGTEFIAEHISATKVIQPTYSDANSVPNSSTFKNNSQYSFLQIPRRPAWTSSMSATELAEKENESFIIWRRKLAELEKIEGVVLTPFERNLEFWRQLWRVVEKSDVIVQILDARNPELYRCRDLERYVCETGRAKKNFLLLNKADLLTAKQRSEWAAYFGSLNIPVAFFSALAEDDSGNCTTETDAQRSECITEPEQELTSSPAIDVESESCGSSCSDSDSAWETASDSSDDGVVDELDKKFWSSSLLSVSQLIEVLKAVGRLTLAHGGLLTVGMVGYPNVGKSSTINKILGAKKVAVSATPGKTKHFQTLFVDDTLLLCDCPGLVMPSVTSSRAEMLVWGILPIDQMRDGFEPVSLICQLIPRRVLCQTYGIVLPKPKDDEPADRPPTAHEFLTVYAFLRGFMSSKGLPDWQRAARYVVRDFTTGKLRYCVAPKGTGQSNFNVWESAAQMSPVKLENNATLQTLAKRHLLEMGSRAEQLDTHFFTVGHSSGFHVRSTKLPAANTTVSAEGGSEKPWKKHHNANRKQKLKKQFGHLDI